MARGTSLAQRAAMFARDPLSTMASILAILAAACGPVEAPPPAGAPGAPPDAITATIYNRTNADRAA